METIDTPGVRHVLEREHAAAKRQRAGGRRAGSGAKPKRPRRDFRDAAHFQHRYLAVGPTEGALLYMLARAQGARRLVEFGSSFGISTLYLAAAAAENDGYVIGSEYYENKQRHAAANLTEAGLTERAEVRLGDARETLADIDGPVDFLFLDGDKSLYLDVLERLLPRLADEALIVADNVDHFDPGDRGFPHLIGTDPTRFTTRLMRVAKGQMSVTRFHRPPAA